MADLCFTKPEVVISQTWIEICRQFWFADRFWRSETSDINKQESGSSIKPPRPPS